MQVIHNLCVTHQQIQVYLGYAFMLISKYDLIENHNITEIIQVRAAQHFKIKAKCCNMA